MARKLGISTAINVYGGSKNDIVAYIKEAMVFCKNAGFDALDFTFSLLRNINGDRQAIMQDILSYSETVGIRFELCHLPFGCRDTFGTPVYHEFAEKVRQAVDAISVLGVKYGVLHPNSVTIPESEFDRRVQFKLTYDHLAPLVEYTREHGIEPVIENMRCVPEVKPYHRYCGNAEELCTVADALGVGICWDFGHANINHLIQSNELRYIGDRLKMVHVNDNVGWGDDHIPPLLGKIDWHDAMQGLNDIGYQGLFNYELSMGTQPENTRSAFAAYMISAAETILRY